MHASYIEGTTFASLSPLYLYEMQFRYNHRDEDLFELFLDYLLKPVPNVS